MTLGTDGIVTVYSTSKHLYSHLHFKERFGLWNFFRGILMNLGIYLTSLF